MWGHSKRLITVPQHSEDARLKQLGDFLCGISCILYTEPLLKMMPKPNLNATSKDTFSS